MPLKGAPVLVFHYLCSIVVHRLRVECTQFATAISRKSVASIELISSCPPLRRYPGRTAFVLLFCNYPFAQRDLCRETHNPALLI